MVLKNLFRQANRYLEKVQNPFPPAERLLYNFASEEDRALWNIFTDKEYGGKSTAELAPSRDGSATAEFRGEISTEVIEAAGEGRMQRSGFAGMNTEEMLGQYLDTEACNALTFRVRGDGRKYIANLRTANWVIGEGGHDVWQAFLFARKGEWQEVKLPFERFLLTYRGRLVETRTDMNPSRIVSLGISLAGGGGVAAQANGPFCLGVEWIKAKSTDTAGRSLEE